MYARLRDLHAGPNAVNVEEVEAQVHEAVGILGVVRAVHLTCQAHRVLGQKLSLRKLTLHHAGLARLNNSNFSHKFMFFIFHATTRVHSLFLTPN
jgi:hypothetical protein